MSSFNPAPVRPYIVEQPDRARVPGQLWPLIEALTQTTQDRYGTEFVGSYVLGGVTTGRFRPGSSDLDFYSVIRGDVTPADQEWLNVTRSAFIERFKVVPKIDLKLYTLQALQTHPNFEGDRIVFKTEGILVGGEEALPHYELPESLTGIALGLAREKFLVIPAVRASLSAQDNSIHLGSQIAKQLIRLSYYVALIRGTQATYTSAVEKQGQIVRAHVPDFRETLDWAESILAAPPLTYESLKTVYDQGMQHLARFEPELATRDDADG